MEKGGGKCLLFMLEELLEFVEVLASFLVVEGGAAQGALGSSVVVARPLVVIASRLQFPRGLVQVLFGFAVGALLFALQGAFVWARLYFGGRKGCRDVGESRRDRLGEGNRSALIQRERDRSALGQSNLSRRGGSHLSRNGELLAGLMGGRRSLMGVGLKGD